MKSKRGSVNSTGPLLILISNNCSIQQFLKAICLMGECSYQAKYLLGSILYILHCICAAHRFIKCRNASKYWKECINPVLIAGDGIFCDTAGKGNYRLTIFLCNFCDTDRRLSHDSLTIKAAFSCYNYVGILNIVAKLCLLKNNLIPDSSEACKKVKKAKPSPPAAPAPEKFLFASGKHLRESVA